MKKFVASDLLGVLRAIVETNTKHHQEDFDMDIQNLDRCSQKRRGYYSGGSDIPMDGAYLWDMVCAGEECFYQGQLRV